MVSLVFMYCKSQIKIGKKQDCVALFEKVDINEDNKLDLCEFTNLF